MSLLLTHPDVKLDAVDDEGDTAVILACMENSTESMKLLMEDKRWDFSIVNCKTKSNKAAMVIAVCKNYLEMTKMLLDQNNVNVNIKSSLGYDEGRTALHCAMCNGNLEILKMLLVDNDDRTALYYASVNGHVMLNVSDCS